MVVELDAFSPATVMLRALAERQVSAVELLDLHQRRIECYNPALNAIVTLDLDRARAAAVEADRTRERGERRALLGLPLTIKDSIDVAGLRTVCGMRSRTAVSPADADAPAVARLRAAGAIIMGKTNTPTYTGDWQTNNRVFGRTNNPWDLSRTPGGSSGGAAAAVAAGLSPLDIGSDIGGSIRVPAAFCGIVGHRPSETAVPRSGHYPGFPLPNPARVMNVLGPLARSADDLDLALGVIAGPEIGEDVAWRLSLPPPRHERLADFRVAVLRQLDWLPVDGEIQAGLDHAVEALRHLGARVGEARPKSFGDLREYSLLFNALLGLMFGLEQSREEREQEAERVRASTDDPFELAYVQGRVADAVEFVDWHRRREVYRAAYREFFKEWDVLLTPITLVPAFPHIDAPFAKRTLTVNGQTVPYGRQWVYPAFATLAGQPATAFPAGRCHDGLPIGLQAVGPYLEDRTPIRFAGLLSQELGGFHAPPGFDTD